MTVHKLSAGDDYTYLTRQVASARQAPCAGSDPGRLLRRVGNPPGVWLGSGTRDLGMSGTVSEAQTVALFGQGGIPTLSGSATGEASLGSGPARRRALERAPRHPQ